MANEAHKEPTMEEILASIRKIISDESSSPAATAPAPEPEIANDDDDEAATLEEVMFDEEARETAAELEVEEFIDDEEEYEVETAADSFESLVSASRAAQFEPAPAPQPAPVRPAPAPVAAAPVFAKPAPTPAPAPAPKEKPMPASPAYETSALTADSTANAAAGALGKLISKMDLGGDHTLEGLVREMLRPMIKEWLDANLAAIVEEKVEAEVARISRMAR
ncbi:MAG: DUF2497 domain-containing protein [Hyphomonas sp.]|nr:DUF2497 domain-containing protein [Hyphomonas sp.]